MAQFEKERLDMFLGIVRKYMQVRGGLSQKDLAELSEIGVSTMSRFLNQQTKELNAQLIAKIVSKLEIPLHEIIDFVDEEYSDHFIRLVKFYRGEKIEQAEEMAGDQLRENKTSSSATRNVTGKIKIGGKMNTVSFNRRENDYSEQSRYVEKEKGTMGEQIKNLTARQRGFLADFLNLDGDGKDLVVDIGKNIIGYLRQKGMDY